MSYINYNYLHYLWHMYKEGSVVGAAEALFPTPQAIIGQIKALEGRPQGKLFKRKGRELEPSGLGELVFRHAGRMFILSQEMLNVVNYHKESNPLFNVDVADALSRRLVSGMLDVAVIESEQICLCCFGSTHELLLEQPSQYKLDMTISDCPIDSIWQEEPSSVKIGGCSVSFWCTSPAPTKSFPACLEEWRLLIPGRRSTLRHKLLNWVSVQGLKVEILGEFDDVALVKALGAARSAVLIIPTLYAHDFCYDGPIIEVGRMDNVMEGYHATSVERMIQHPAVWRICNCDYSPLFTEPRQPAGVDWRGTGRANACQ